MRMAVPLLVSTLLPLAGCDFKAFHGIFLVQAAPDPEEECTFAVVDHNFTDGHVPEDTEPDTAPWTYTTDGEFSDQLFFMEIIDSANGETLLVVNGAVYPGVKTGGMYQYSWDVFADGTETEEHEEGYEYITAGLDSTEDTILLDRDGRTASGSWTRTSTTSATYSESDEWDSFEVGRFSGEIPSYYYLVDGDGFSLYNEPEGVDCDEEPCALETEESCTFSMTFTATEVSLEDDAYENVEGAGQPGGWE